jgi:uncharacterized protein (TIGR03083 family)
MMTEPIPTAAELTAVGSHAEWMPLARSAYQRVADAFAALGPDDWARQTPCEGWTVRDLGGHLVGAMRAAARLRETLSQQVAVSRRTKQTGEAEVDALTAIQIERTAGLDPAQLVAEMQALVEPAVKGRSRIPGPVRRRARFRVHLGAIDERWTLDYFVGCILTRDAWLHRIDLADALGATPQLAVDDRVIVGDVASEWARRHGEPVRLTLTGPAGGHLNVGTGGDDLTLDAVEFCRVVSGRSTQAHPLLAQPVPF